MYKTIIVCTVLLCTLLSKASSAKSIQINGVVLEQASQQPIPGVSVSIINSNVGTITDEEGRFSLQVQKEDVLHFSVLGFKSKQVIVTADVDNIVVHLKHASQALDELVVTAFGRKQTRNETTANVTTIKAKELTKHHFTEATQALKGKVSGLVLSAPSGTPGATPNIRIRGLNSITASNDPLYVLDGMPIHSGNGGINESESSTIDVFSLINPNDIAEISVLKDASAIAPYGADGANGVILITTKSGQSGKPQYRFSLSGGFLRPTKNGPTMANSKQLWDGVSEGLWNTYGSGEFGNGQIASIDDILDWAVDNNISSSISQWVKNGFANTDWKKEVQRQNAFKTDLNFSVSQGTKTNKFYAGLGYNKTQGVTRGTDFRRWSGYLKYKTDLSSKLNIDLSVTVANVSQNGAIENGDESTGFGNPFTTIYLEVPWAPVRNTDGSYNIGDDWYVFGPKNNYPYMVKHNIRNTDITRAIPMAKLNYKISDHLTFHSLIGLDYILRYFKDYRNTVNSSSVNQHGSILENAARDFHYTTQNSLDYSFQLGNKNNFNLTFLQEFSKYKNNTLEGYGENMANDKLTNLSGASANFSTRSTFNDQVSTRYVALLNYNFNQKYIFNGSYSYQGDSRFSHRFGNFYSLGIGWNLHEENFIKNISTINVLRVKLGFGLTGNAGISRNQYQELMTFGKYNSSPASTLTNFGTEATWEKSKRMDVSVDYAFFNYRLRGSLGVFRNKTFDMLFNVPLPLTSQFLQAEVLRNVGEMKNSGLEIEVSGDVISTPDIQWNLWGNFSTVHNRISALSANNTIRGIDYIVEQGYQAREWYLPEWAGVNSENGLPLWYVNREINNKTTSNFSEAERVHVGKSPIPNYSGAIGTRLDYRNIFIESAIYFVGGYAVYDRWAQHTEGTNASNMVNRPTSAAAIAQAWRKPGDQANYYPRFDYGNKSIADVGQRSTRNLHSGDHIKLSDIAVGYTLNEIPLLETLKINSVTLSLRASNLFTWVKDKRLHYDPSVDDRGRILTTSPPVKSIIFNLNINF